MDACRGTSRSTLIRSRPCTSSASSAITATDIEDAKQLRRLIEIFTGYHKWAVVELIAEKILEYGESSAALRAMALSLERLGRNKDAIPVLESLLKIDRFDAELSKKLAFAIIDDEPEKSIHYMKLSIEGFIKNKKYEEVTSLWTKLVSVSWEDIAFFERIERFLVEAKQFDLVASLLKILLQKYRDERESRTSRIELLKKVLKYRPEDTHARRDLINLYRVKYKRPFAVRAVHEALQAGELQDAGEVRHTGLREEHRLRQGQLRLPQHLEAGQDRRTWTARTS